jgi:hypothetical protein
MDAARLTHGESACASGKRCLMLLLMLASISCSCGGGPSSAPSAAAPTPTLTPTPTPAPAPPKPLNSATITILSSGFKLDAISSVSYSLGDIHLFQGGTLTFVNADIDNHDVLSDPFGAHNDCPELNSAGFITPGQVKITTPLTIVRTCGFHDHDHEGDPAFGGKVTIEAR